MNRLAAIAMIAAVGCGQSAFDDRQRHAPSDSRSAPDGISSADWAPAITTVDREQSGCTIVVAGTGPSSLSTLSYDVDGDLAALGIDAPDAFAEQPVVAGALDRIAGGSGVFAVGDRGSPGQVSLYDARTGDQGPARRAVVAPDACGGLAGLGQALAFGLIDSATDGDPDLAALAGTELVLFHDVDLDAFASAPECDHCSLPGPGAYLAMATIGGPGEDIAVLVDAGDPAAQVIAIDARQMLGVTGACPAPIAVVPSPGPNDPFAPPIAVGDIDDNAFPEIAIAAADRRVVFVAMNVGQAVEPVIERITAVPDSESFGTSLVFGDFDDDDGEELAIGDPDAHPEGVDAAGQVTIFRHTGDEFLASATLYDSEPEPDQRFGRALDIAEFANGVDDPRDVLVVGAADEVFTYFQVLPRIDDPRL